MVAYEEDYTEEAAGVGYGDKEGAAVVVPIWGT
jgi:hypothetical protein